MPSESLVLIFSGWIAYDSLDSEFRMKTLLFRKRNLSGLENKVFNAILNTRLDLKKWLMSSSLLIIVFPRLNILFSLLLRIQWNNFLSNLKDFLFARSFILVTVLALSYSLLFVINVDSIKNLIIGSPVKEEINYTINPPKAVRVPKSPPTSPNKSRMV